MMIFIPKVMVSIFLVLAQFPCDYRASANKQSHGCPFLWRHYFQNHPSTTGKSGTFAQEMALANRDCGTETSSAGENPLRFQTMFGVLAM
jgi:hypothetical protein